jgi:hypothetical protein
VDGEKLTYVVRNICERCKGLDWPALVSTRLCWAPQAVAVKLEDEQLASRFACVLLASAIR